ncbi:hypothetical protein BJF83_21345 [Nocardiopsis sp. CNR-923]|nr:hypothetical protein BJF83_21345 [Nocardiopsis sp. CNR-923]
MKPLVTTPITGCRVSVVSVLRDEYEPLHETETSLFHLRYWSTCPTCGHTGPYRTDENEAAEDGHDHAFPGWRNLPVMGARPYHEHRGACAAWEADALRVYPQGWFEAAGPILTERPGGGTRHVPGRAPGGGFDIGIPTPTRRPSAEAEQLDLFDIAGQRLRTECT